MEEVAIHACPPDVVPRALEILFRTLPEDEQQAMVASLGAWLQTEPSGREGLFVAHDHHALLGAVLVQEQPGRTAILWPPSSLADDRAVEVRLAGAADEYLTRLKATFAQALLADSSESAVAALESIGFARLAELEYLIATSRLASLGRNCDSLHFQRYNEAERSRMGALLEATYADSLDCPQLNGVRDIDDVLTGYQATGQFDPGRWFFVVEADRDIGALLLTEHVPTRQWELIYMGLVPEARRRGLGREIVAFALEQAFANDAESVLLAVDAANHAAVKLYRSCGFRGWSQRVVYWKVYGPR